MDEKIILKTDTPEYGEAYMEIYFSDKEPVTAHCDACIGYFLYSPEILYAPEKAHEFASGDMDYRTDKSGYKTLEDAIPDMLEFAFGFVPNYERIG